MLTYHQLDSFTLLKVIETLEKYRWLLMLASEQAGVDEINLTVDVLRQSLKQRNVDHDQSRSDSSTAI